MKKIIKYILLTFISLVSCNSVEPEEEIINYPPGSRNYEWQQISLREIGPNNLYSQLGGVSTNEIWIISHAGDFDKTILKYNGSIVSNYGSLSVDPNAVFGLDSNEIWFTGSAFDIWKYNGISISKFNSYILDDYYNSFLVDIWGNAKNNIYAVGSGTVTSSGRAGALIMHYDGNLWEYSISPIPDLHFVRIKKGETDSKYYLMGVEVKPGIPDSYGFYEFDGSNVKRFNLSEESNTIEKNITLLDNIVFFYDNKEIYKMITDKVNHFTSLKNTNVYGSQIWGRSEKDFFIQTLDGIGHYNGSNLETLFKIQGNFGIFDGLILDSDIYFVGFYRNTLECFLIHGVKNND